MSGGVAAPAFGGLASSNLDNFDPAAGVLRQVFLTEGLIYNIVTNKWERIRTPTAGQKQNNGTASFNVWTPAAGKKFRLMGYIMTLTANSIQAVAGPVLFQLTDGGAVIPLTTFEQFVPGAIGPTGPPLLQAVVVLPGNGYLSAAANNVLQGAISATLTGGQFSVDAWGNEE